MLPNSYVALLVLILHYSVIERRTHSWMADCRSDVPKWPSTLGLSNFKGHQPKIRWN